MRRIVSALLVSAAVGATAAPAMAFNSGTPPGPPEFSGGPREPSAFVAHCKALEGTKSVLVFNSQGLSGGGTCFPG